MREQFKQIQILRRDLCSKCRQTVYSLASYADILWARVLVPKECLRRRLCILRQDTRRAGENERLTFHKAGH